jgi:predicted RNA binding protein YcfA (HicA-like mRNA interferase family)
MPRLPRVSVRELIRALEEQGFVLSRSKGSHRIYRHPKTAKRVTVPYHGGRTVPPGTLANILREAGIDRDELRELLGR